MTATTAPVLPSEDAIEEAAAVYRAILDDPERAAVIREHRARLAAQAATTDPK